MQQFAAVEIGERIAQARKEADGMTQEQLAELLNVSTRSVQDYESGATIPLQSDRVIINAPMSFAGATQRAWRMRESASDNAGRWVLTFLIVLLVLPLWWTLIVAWYVVFGLLLIPYRLLRRGARKRKAEALRHQETLAAIGRRDAGE